MDSIARAWIEELRLEPIPEEGGWFRRLSEGVSGDGECGPSWSSIVALFTREGFSAIHRLTVDELWFFQSGDPIEMLLLPAAGEDPTRGTIARLGLNVAAGEQPQLRVPAGVWQGARPVGDQGWSLVSCVCVPGFRRESFTLGQRTELTATYPDHRDAIERLTRG